MCGQWTKSAASGLLLLKLRHTAPIFGTDISSVKVWRWRE